jgi:hypothetical protein
MNLSNAIEDLIDLKLRGRPTLQQYPDVKQYREEVALYFSQLRAVKAAIETLGGAMMEVRKHVQTLDAPEDRADKVQGHPTRIAVTDAEILTFGDWAYKQGFHQAAFELHAFVAKFRDILKKATEGIAR